MAEEKETKKKEATPNKKPKVKAPTKKESNNNKAVKKAVIKPMVHINEFLDVATDMYGLSTMQQAGFKAYMTGKQYLGDLEAFIPYLNRYLGK